MWQAVPRCLLLSVLQAMGHNVTKKHKTTQGVCKTPSLRQTRCVCVCVCVVILRFQASPRQQQNDVNIFEHPYHGTKVIYKPTSANLTFVVFSQQRYQTSVLGDYRLGNHLLINVLSYLRIRDKNVNYKDNSIIFAPNGLISDENKYSTKGCQQYLTSH